MASQLDIPYFLGLLYLMLQFEDKARSSFKLSEIAVDSDSVSAIKFANEQFHFSQKLQDSSSTEPSKNIFSPSFAKGSYPARNYRSTSKAVLRTFVHPFSSAHPEESTMGHKCLRRFHIYGKSWNKSVCISCTPQFCLESFDGLDAQDKCSLRSESDLENSSTSSNANSCKKFLKYFALMFFLVVFFVMTLRWKTFLKAKRKLDICSENSTTHVFSTSKNIWGTIFVLLTLSDLGNSSSVTSNVTVSSNDTTVNTPWTSDSIPNSFTPMPSSSPFDARFTSSQTSYQTTQTSFSNGGNNTLGGFLDSSLENTASSAAVSALVTSSVYLSVSNSQTTLTLNPGNSLTVETLSFKSSYILPSITLDTKFTSVSLYSIQSRLMSTNVENTSSVSSLWNEFFTSTSAFIEATSQLQRATDVSVSQVRSTFSAPHTNESLTHSVSGVKSSIFTTYLPMHEHGSSVASLTGISSSTYSTSDYHKNTTTILSVRLSPTSKLLSSLPPSTQSSSSTSMLSSLTPQFLSAHESSSEQIASSPLESSSQSIQFPLTSTMVVTIITNLPSLLSSSLSSALLITSPSSSSSRVNVYTPSLLSPTTAQQASTPLSLLSSSSPSSVSTLPFLLLLTSTSISPSLSLPTPLSLSSSSPTPSLTSSPASSPSPSLPLPSISSPSSSSSSSSSPSPSPPTPSRSPLPSLSSSLPPLSSLLPLSPSSPPTLPSPSQSSLLSSPLSSLPLSSSPTSSSSSPSLSQSSSPSPSPSRLSSTLTSPSTSIPSPPLSHSSLSSPPSSLLPSSSTLPTLSPSATTLPSFSSALLLATSKALGSTVLQVSASLLISSTFLRWSNSSQQQTWSSLESLLTVNFTSSITNQVMISVTLSDISQETLVSYASSSIAHLPPTTTPQDRTRIINVTFSLIKEGFHSDLSNERSAKFMNLSQRVNSTLWKLFFQTVEGLKEIKILKFSQGSVKVDSKLLFSSSSNVTAQVVNQTLLRGNGTNNDNGFIFSKIVVKETCTPGYCMNSGSCQEGVDGAICSCSTGFVGPRCARVPATVNGNYTEWSEFTECSKTCDGGQKSRRRACTNPPPQNGGKDCEGLGQDIEYVDCNADVRCPVSAEIWIAVGIACGVLLIILILALFFFLRRRRKQAEQRNGSNKDFYSNGHNTMIPLEVIYEDKTMPQSSPKGHLNPEFIGEDDDDNDIYKAQLLLFLKQSHLIRPNIYPDEQDNKSDASDYSGKNSRKVSAVSTASDKNQEYNDEPTVEIQSAQDPDNLSAGQTKRGENVLQSTEL